MINRCAMLSRQWWRMLLSLSMLLKVSNLTPLPPSIHTRSRCHVANGDVATNNRQSMTNYSQPGEPSDCPPPLIFSHEKQVPRQLMMEQQCGTTMTWDINNVTRTWQSHLWPQWCRAVSKNHPTTQRAPMIQRGHGWWWELMGRWDRITLHCWVSRCESSYEGKRRVGQRH